MKYLTASLVCVALSFAWLLAHDKTASVVFAAASIILSSLAREKSA